MRLSKSFVPTLKEVPTEAVIPSHILMLRAGLIRMLSAGIYSFLPLGYKSIKKICEVIREEMDKIGGQEFHLPALNPKEIWEETGRVEAFGDIMFHIKNREYVLAPTHEEIMAYHAKGNLNSYKDLPQIWYQIQTKFRNEPRPKSGVIRGRQFLMKDAYSFDSSWENLDKSYQAHFEAYKRIFDRCGLKYFVVGASSGAMGGAGSEEFMVQSDAGEDTVAHCEKCGYSANVEVASSIVNPAPRFPKSEQIKDIHTPDIKSIDELCEFLSINETQCAKSRIYIHENFPVLVLMLGNDEVNETKLSQALPGALRPGHPEELKQISGAEAGSIGPVGFNGKIIADFRLKNANNLFSGANKDNYHISGIDLQRDVPNAEFFDLRTAQANEGCPKCRAKLGVFKAIELGHIFKLGIKYTKALGVNFLDEKGQEHPIIMGSYGIGVERILACYLEQNRDDKGIVWDKVLAPYLIHLIGLNLKNSDVRSACENIYEKLTADKLDALYDDRDVSAGVKFNDADLIGLPLQIIVGEKNLRDNKVEIKIRKTAKKIVVSLDELYSQISILLN